MDGSQSALALTHHLPNKRPFSMHPVILGAVLGLLCTLGPGAVWGADDSAAPIVPESLPAFEVDAAAKPLPTPGDFSPPPRLLRIRPRVIEAKHSPATAVLTKQPVYRLATTATSVDTAASPPVPTSPDQPDTRTSHPPSVEAALATRGSVTFRKTPLSEVVFLLSDLWRINIVAGDNVTGEVSGAFHDAPLSEVLTAVLSSSGYSYRKTGSSLIVLSADQVGADDATFVSKTLFIPPQLREGEEALEAAQMLLSDRGKINRIGEGMILVIDSAERIERVEDLYRGFHGNGTSREGTSDGAQSVSASLADNGGFATQFGIAYFTPQFTEAELMAEPLQAALGESVVVAVFPEENRIMVKGSPQDLEVASEAIEQLDRARPQVRITATIYDVSLSEVERLGINWNFSPHSGGTGLTDIADAESIRFRNLITASTNLVTDPAASGAGNFAISTLNDTINVDTLLQALHNNSEAKLLADPSVTVGDRREASIRIVQKVPIIAADPVDNSGVVFSQVQFEEAGVILNVQPRISRDGTIDMKVNPEFSVVSDFIQNNPVIDSRAAETTVRVANGQTFVIGGLRQKSVIESVRGVPFLKDMKFIGKWFRSHDTEIQESELIVFLKPELVTPYQFGTPREREASRVLNEELDAIPHAQTCPLTPCCQDPYCPNHHPKPKANGGSQALRYSDFGEAHLQQLGEPQVQSVEIIESLHQNNLPLAATANSPSASLLEEVEVTAEQALPAPAEADGGFPPVHIAPPGH